MKKTLALLALIGFSGFSAATTDNLINNGSFESVNQTAGSWKIYYDLTDWNVGAKGVEIRNGAVGSASEGNNFVELDTSANSWISQTFMASAGTTYSLSFDYSPRNISNQKNKSGYEESSNKIDVSIKQGASKSFNEIVKGNNSLNGNEWVTKTFTFSGLSNGLATLKFKALGASDSYGGSLDNVRLAVVSSVPEPETYAMFLAGLGLMVGVARRRKQAA